MLLHARDVNRVGTALVPQTDRGHLEQTAAQFAGEDRVRLHPAHDDDPAGCARVAVAEHFVAVGRRAQ
jgi:hypothetical protein